MITSENTKITKKNLPETVDKVTATFEFYWNDKEFECYDEGQRERLAHALRAGKYYDSNNPDIYTMDIQPYSYQNEHGIPAIFLTGKSPDEERRNAKENLVSGEVRFIFVVDIYNEGVDISEVNTVLFLRPTESMMWTSTSFQF